ncbi:MAG: exosome complex exonuclease Rrp41 [Candidatus Woesearchaeota archaeon]
MTEKFKREKRKNDELRPMEAKAGVISKADGSAYFQIGKTSAYAAVYGPRNLHPKFKQDPEQGLLRCHYNMMPFSGTGNRVRPGQNRRAKEISMVTEKALMPVLSFQDFPNSVVDVFIEVPQADAGTRCAGICAASIALADAGFAMKELVSAVSVGKVNDTVLVDLDYNEEAWDGEVADIPVAMLPSTGEISLLQMDGKITKEQLAEALGTVKDACLKINEVQKKALYQKYEEIEADIESSAPIDSAAKKKMVADAEDVNSEGSDQDEAEDDDAAEEKKGDDDE